MTHSHRAEDTLWSGGPTDWNNPGALESLPVVRELVMEGKYAEATTEATKMLGPDPQVQFFSAIIELADIRVLL